MSATQRSRTARTEHFYAITFASLRAQAAHATGAQAPEHVAPMTLVEHLIKRKPDLAKRTWQTYKSAVRAQLEHAAGQAPSLQDAQEIQYAIQILDSEGQAGALRRTNRTSARKAKQIQDADLQAIYDHLQKLSANELEMRGPRSASARALLTWCQATSLVGVRPGEWLHADRITLPGGEPALLVQNAKNTHGRGNGKTRTLKLGALSPEQLESIEQMLELVDGHRDAESFARLTETLRKTLRRIAQRVLGKRRSYPALYSFRHQFAADAKSAGDGTATVAALLGQASDETAIRNYAPARVGRGRVLVQPLPEEVATVRLKAKPKPFSRPK